MPFFLKRNIVALKLPCTALLTFLPLHCNFTTRCDGHRLALQTVNRPVVVVTYPCQFGPFITQWGGERGHCESDAAQECCQLAEHVWSHPKNENNEQYMESFPYAQTCLCRWELWFYKAALCGYTHLEVVRTFADKAWLWFHHIKSDTAESQQLFLDSWDVCGTLEAQICSCRPLESEYRLLIGHFIHRSINLDYDTC